MQLQDLRNHLDILGHRVREKVTGVEGVATSVSFDLYGCIQVTVDRGFDEKGMERRAHWFDMNRLEKIGVPDKPGTFERVMQPPYFEQPPTPAHASAGGHGAADKPQGR